MSRLTCRGEPWAGTAPLSLRCTPTPAPTIDLSGTSISDNGEKTPLFEWFIGGGVVFIVLIRCCVVGLSRVRKSGGGVSKGVAPLAAAVSAVAVFDVEFKEGVNRGGSTSRPPRARSSSRDGG